jgi:hypothetical protein
VLKGAVVTGGIAAMPGALGDRRVHVLKVTHDTLTLDTRFDLDFNTAFEYPARPTASP